MRSHVHAFLLVSLLLLACFPALGNTWSDHPAVEQFHVDTEALPGTLYLVRTRGELPPGTEVTVHAEKNGLFLVSGPEGEVMALVQLGCGVFPLYEPGEEPETTSRIWETISVPD